MTRWHCGASGLSGRVDGLPATPLQKIYNYLCGQDLELNCSPPHKKNEEALSGIMLSAHAPPPTTETAMHVFLSSDSAEFILIDFRLLDYL